MANSKKRCKKCREYVPAESGVKVPAGFFCSTRHAIDWANAKSRRDNERARRAKTRADKARIETLQECITKAQADINKFITTYDRLFHGKCIASEEQISDCGHFFHRGTKYRTSWLTLFHGNLHGQGAHSNRYSGGGDSYNFRRGIIKRYGKSYLQQLLRFKRLEDRGEMPRPTKDEVRACAEWHRAMTRLYQKQTEGNQ